MKVTYTIFACCCLAAVVFVLTDSSSHATAQEKPESQKGKPTEKQEELSKFMRQKLAASNQILEGLVTDDLTLVEKSAEQLLKMSDAEHWRASNDVMYLNHSLEFRRSVKAMLAKAEKKSIDGAALAWMDVTMSCIRCHEWVRDTMLADASSEKSAASLARRLKISPVVGGGK
jgi:hypothetical protein